MPSKELEGVGRQIAAAREEEGLTQAELAAKVGVHAMTVSKWERGEQTVRGKNLRRVREALPAFDAVFRAEDGTTFVVEAKSSRDVRGDSYPQEMWPEPEPDDPREVREYLTFFGADPEGFRRMARHLPLSDIAKAALQTALDEDMSSAHFEILYRRLKHLLPRDEADED